MIRLNEIFEKNIQFSKYGRSGCIVLTKNKNKAKLLQKSGWNCYLRDNQYRLNPPTLNLVDIVDPEKAIQYQNIIFNFSLYEYLIILYKSQQLSTYCNKIVESHKIFFNNFSFHISIGPILKYVIKIEGSDNRVYQLKLFLIDYLLKDSSFLKIYNKNQKMITNSQFMKIKQIDKENIKLQEEYIIQYNAHSYNSKDKCIAIDFSQIRFESYDYIIFILNGCFKIISYLDLKQYKDKIIFWEIHMDETKGPNKLYNIEKLKNKSILVIDSVYSGKTMLYIKNILKPITDKIQTLGVFPKSDKIANICDYNLILNKVVKKRKNGFKVQNEIMKILNNGNK